MPEADHHKPNKGNSSLLQYSGMVLELFLLGGIGTYAGSRLDKWLDFDFPLFTIVLLLAGMGIALYRIYRQTENKGE